jgi:PAS domain S-box-containing protein
MPKPAERQSDSDPKARVVAVTLQARFGNLLESVPDATLIIGRAGSIALVNTQLERMFGYARDELLGQPVEILVPERFRGIHVTHRGSYLADPHLRPMGAGLELHGRRKDGTEFPVEISLSPMESEDGRLVCAAIRDITSQKRLEMEIVQQNEALARKNVELEEQYRRVQESSRLKSEFLANMSHELRTPLNAIIGFAELLHDGKVGSVTGEQQEFLGDILTGSRHLLRLISDMLDYAKLEAGRMEFRPETLDLAQVLGEVRDLLASAAASQGITVTIEIAPGLAEVTLDPGKLKQVLHSYLSNALKFTQASGQVTVRALPEGREQVRFEVEDTGVGIGTDDIPRLFVEFQQLDGSSAKKYGGAGLGLALARQIVQAQGGRVGVRSAPGQGSTFFAMLPRRGTSQPGPAAHPVWSSEDPRGR